jgi:hypothetical protein
MWIMSISLLLLPTPLVSHSCQNRSIWFCKSDCPVLGHQICPAPTSGSSKFFWTCPVINPDMSGLSTKISSWIKIFHFGLSPPSTLIYVIMRRFCGSWIRSEVLMRKFCQWNISLCDLEQVLTLSIFGRSSSSKRLCQENQD